jgi:dipeptidyl-peptidase-4
MLNSGFGKNQVTTAINAYADAQWYADQGFIVVCADVDGAPDRGRETEETVKDDLLDLPLDDQADAITELAKAVPEIDFTRVGVVGEGACGGLAIAGPIRRPYIFACGAAVSPITDWSIVETGLAERYLGLPSVDPSGYKTSSAITYTVHSQRPLLVLQSAVAADSTFAGSLKLAETMYQTGKPIDFVPIAVDTEGTLKPDDQIALHSRLLQFFKEQLKP